jgi:hypothetical protein
MLAAFLVASGCGSDKRSNPVSPTPLPNPSPSPHLVSLHDTLVTGSSLISGTHAITRGRQYSAPFDDFNSPVDAVIRLVEWQGYYCNTAFTGSAIPDAVATFFVIRISPAEPGAERPPFVAFHTEVTTGAHHVAVVPAAMVTQQLEFTRLDAACGARNEGDPAAFYRFSATLPSPYPVTAGGGYWISISAVLPEDRVSWHWRFGAPDNKHSIFWANGTLTTFFNDRAFTIGAR